MNDRERALMGCVSVFMLALLMLVYIALEVRSRVRASDIKAWPIVSGNVIYSAPEKDCGKGLHYSPKIRYSYYVNGRYFEGAQVQYQFFRCGSKDAIAGFTSKYPVGATLAVHVNPDSPGDAVAIVDKEQGQDSVPIAVWVAAFVGFLFASGAYFRRYRALTDTEREDD